MWAAGYWYNHSTIEPMRRCVPFRTTVLDSSAPGVDVRRKRGLGTHGARATSLHAYCAVIFYYFPMTCVPLAPPQITS